MTERLDGRPSRLFRNLNAKIASIPMILTALVVFVGGTVWTVLYSFTNSKLLPRLNFVGLDQYERLWTTPRWLVSIENLLIYGVLSLIFSLLIGFLLAALLDQKIRFEDTFRTIFLYPFALSFIVTGLVWQWILNPDFGVQHVVRGARLGELHLRPALRPGHRHLRHPDRRRSGRAPGLVMCLMLAGLRGIDEDIWKAARVDGIPMWKTYLFIVIPMMRPVFITTLVIIAQRHRARLRPRRGADQRRPGHRLRSAGEVRLRLHVPRAEPRPGLRRLDHDAADGRDHRRALGLSRIRRRRKHG